MGEIERTDWTSERHVLGPWVAYPAHRLEIRICSCGQSEERQAR